MSLSLTRVNFNCVLPPLDIWGGTSRDARKPDWDASTVSPAGDQLQAPKSRVASRIALNRTGTR